MDARPALSCIIGTEAREGDGEEALLLKLGEEVGKRRLRLEFMEGRRSSGSHRHQQQLAEQSTACLVQCRPIRFHGRSGTWFVPLVREITVTRSAMIFYYYLLLRPG